MERSRLLPTLVCQQAPRNPRLDQRPRAGRPSGVRSGRLERDRAGNVPLRRSAHDVRAVAALAPRRVWLSLRGRVRRAADLHVEADGVDAAKRRRGNAGDRRSVASVVRSAAEKQRGGVFVGDGPVFWRGITNLHAFVQGTKRIVGRGKANFNEVRVGDGVNRSDVEGAMPELRAILASEVDQVNDNRYLLLWPLLGANPMSQIDLFLTTIAPVAASQNIVLSLSSFYRYLLDVNGANKERLWPVFNWERIQVQSVAANGLYSAQPLLHRRHQSLFSVCFRL